MLSAVDHNEKKRKATSDNAEHSENSDYASDSSPNNDNDNDDDDDEIPEKTKLLLDSTTHHVKANMDIDENNFPVLLRLFYQRLFPYKSYFKWLNYDTVPTKNFTNREFSFTLMNDVYLRWNSFKDLADFKAELLRLCPAKIDIGAVYTARPKDKKTIRAEVFLPVEKELVFDIDMTDYDEVRTCCTGGDICRDCWEFMTVAIKVLDAYLREDFGFKYLLWVYSGRRGVHCWVADERARKLSNEARRAVVSFIEVVKGGMHQSKKVNLPEKLHPSLNRSLDVLRRHFLGCILERQDVLGSPEQWEKVLALLPDEGMRSRLHGKWQKTRGTSLTRWEELKGEIADALKEKMTAQRKSALNNCPRDITFQYIYPRLDDKVTIQINHLLKSPFCVHPKTGKVCVPIVASECDTFDPTTVPTVASLVREINDYDEREQSMESTRRLNDWEKTSLKPYIKVFDEFVKDLLTDVREKKRAEASSSMTF